MKYKKDYEALHSRGYFRGLNTLLYKKRILRLIDQTNSISVLDYGSGKGRQYTNHKLNEYWRVDVECYDPGCPEYSTLPDKEFDGVICIEVLEHIPEDEIDEALSNIFSRASRFVFLTVCLEPSNDENNKTLLDGSNVHVTLKSEEWWRHKIDAHNTRNVLLHVVMTGLQRPKAS